MDKIRQSFLRTVRTAVERSGARRLLACVSGGADSVALLLALKACRLDVTALHCNFHLRGEESMRDQRFVEQLCSRIGVPLLVKDFDVSGRMASHPETGGTEEACRELRYEWFREMAAKLDAVITTGHNSDDNVETLLLNLFRGSGVNGLSCMREFNGEILRPLIATSREEILAFLADEGEAFVTDSTNLKSDFRRNFIRNELLPLVETRWPGAQRAMLRTITNIQGEESLLRMWVGENISGRDSLPFSMLPDETTARSAIHYLIAPHGGNSTIAGEAARTLFTRPYLSGRRWPLPDGTLLTAERDSLQLLEPDRLSALRSGEEIFECTEIPNNDATWQEILKDRSNLTLYLPRPLSAYTLRHPERGDRIRPLGMRGSRLLSDVMKDAGLTLRERESLWIVADATTGEPVWAEGLRRSRLHAVTPGEGHVYRIRRRDSDS